ncbi:MAG: inositol monophosphatase family protein [Microcoleus sp.]
MSEETAQRFPDKEWCWIVELIDGTSNFSQGLPLWSISLGLLEQGNPVFGYVYLPELKQSFYGFYNGVSCLTIPTVAFQNHQAISPISALPHKQHFFNFYSHKNPVSGRRIKTQETGFFCVSTLSRVFSVKTRFLADASKPS